MSESGFVQMTASVGECVLFCCGALCGDLAQIGASVGAPF
ncbi:hypothetical protein PCAR4_1090060 [Paraburkholderia caribensis]|nr:hypothetical protein PCAR4_1090060 [Paraburkholderia caribensis]